MHHIQCTMHHQCSDKIVLNVSPYHYSILDPPSSSKYFTHYPEHSSWRLIGGMLAAVHSFWRLIGGTLAADWRHIGGPLQTLPIITDSILITLCRPEDLSRRGVYSSISTIHIFSSLQYHISVFIFYKKKTRSPFKL